MKAVLVIDMPESCSKCKFMYEFYGVKKCQLLNILENGGKAIIPIKKLTTERKDCCPLKPMLEADEIRNKAIEEFAEKFIYKAVCEGCSGCTYCYENEYQRTCDEYMQYMEIAEQMKGKKR